MSFCKFSPSYQTSNKTIVDNTFINEFLPKAPDMCVKIYLLGLSKCSSPDDSENSLSYFAETLKICEDDVISLFKYWEDLGLVQVLSTNPIEIRYLPINSNTASIKKYKVDKYTDFNIQVQELFDKRMVMPNEFTEFYDLMERKHMEQSALLELIRYCVNYKGFNLSPNYVITVAKDWIREGVLTLDAVKAKIEELGIADDKMSLILSAMGSKRKVQLEDKELLTKWLSSYGFELNVIIFVIKNLKTKKRRLDVNVLDDYLSKYYEMRLMSIPEIENYEKEKENLYFIAITINKELGIFYEDLTKEIDTYIMSWLNMGYDAETLKTIANNCFLSSIKTLEGLNNIINKLYKLGIVNLKAYQQYLNDNLAVDKKIKEVLENMNLTRNVNNMDRNFYRTWTVDWGFSHEVILYGASLSSGKNNAIQYLNKILSNWNANGAKTLEQVKNSKIEAEPQNEFIHNNYTKEQIASLLTNLDEVEV
ncbi:MAG TPA: DnaD domain protein [Candidatus Onthoplasma faecigallinarum]|nr:DnaD domain protein [Candidatus Onthoplasma faecigallinarum]